MATPNGAAEPDERAALLNGNSLTQTGDVIDIKAAANAEIDASKSGIDGRWRGR